MLTNFQEKLAALTPRERVIVGLTVLVSVWWLWDSFIYEPLQQRHTRLQQSATALVAQITAQNSLQQQLERNPKMDPNQPNRLKLAALKADVSRMQEALLLGDKKFVPPQLMAKALGDMFNQNAGTHLVKLAILPVITLLTAEPPQLPIYKHGLAVTFSGDYRSTYRYLTALEALPWHFDWAGIDYTVKEHPLAETTLTVYTLSFEEGWLGG